MSEHTCGGRGTVPCPACTDMGAQAAFVRQWRAEHPYSLFEKPWICDLCGLAVQWQIAGVGPSPAGYNPTQEHQYQHGSDWTAYAALGAEARRDERGESGE